MHPSRACSRLATYRYFLPSVGWGKTNGGLKADQEGAKATDTGRPLLAFDVGGTNTRVRAAILGPTGTLGPHPAIGDGLSEKVSSRDDLYQFVSRILALFSEDRPAAAALAAAGPIEDRRSLSMTNWLDDRLIDLGELEQLGLPSGKTVMLNDLEAGALGLLASLEEDGPESRAFGALHEPEGVDWRQGHLVFVAPGTGLGSAGILRDGRGHLVVPCEVQHTPIPTLEARVARVIDRIRKVSRRERVSWEDVVSGRGLLDTYSALCELNGLLSFVSAVPPEDEGQEPGHVAAIARAAIEGEDTVCSDALDLYYLAAGAFSQMLALTFLPCTGVFLGGDTTRKNREYIPGSRFLDALQDNPVHGEMLERVPVHLVLEETNLAGALRCAAGLAEEREAASSTG